VRQKSSLAFHDWFEKLRNEMHHPARSLDSWCSAVPFWTSIRRSMLRGALSLTLWIGGPCLACDKSSTKAVAFVARETTPSKSDSCRSDLHHLLSLAPTSRLTSACLAPFSPRAVEREQSPSCRLIVPHRLRFSGANSPTPCA
jgi:hypothetical protein